LRLMRERLTLEVAIVACKDNDDKCCGLWVGIGKKLRGEGGFVDMEEGSGESGRHGRNAEHVKGEKRLL